MQFPTLSETSSLEVTGKDNKGKEKTASIATEQCIGKEGKAKGTARETDQQAK